MTDAEPIPGRMVRFRREARRYRSGLPGDLTPTEVELVDHNHRDSRAPGAELDRARRDRAT